MASCLKNTVSFIAVGPGVQATLPHGLHRENVGQVPDSIRLDNPFFTTVSADATNIVVQNNAPIAQDVIALAEAWHSVDRNFVAQMQPALVPQPFSDNGSVSLGGVQPSVFVFRPGGVAAGNVYTDWALLVADLPSVEGAKVIEFDDSIVTPCVIPAGGPYDMTDVTLSGQTDRATYVSVANGATFTGLRKFANNLRLSFLTVAPNPSPVADLVSEDYVDLRDSAWVHAGGVTTVPFFDLSGLGAGDFVTFTLTASSAIGYTNSGNPVIGGLPNGAELYNILADSCYIGRGSITSVAGSFVYTALLQGSFIGRSQTGLLGTHEYYTNAGPLFEMWPQSGTVPSVAAVNIRYEHGSYVRLNATAGVITQVLPEIGGTGALNWFNGGRITVIRETSGIDGVTVDGYGAETIEGAATYALPPGGAAMFISNGVSNWRVIGINMNHVLNRLNTSTKAQGTAQVALADNVAGITPDLTLSNSFQCALGAVAGNTRQLGVPTGMVAGFTYIFEFVQPSAPTAVQALTYNATWWKFPGGVIPTLTATNDAKDILTFYYDGTAMMCVHQADFRNP